MKRNLLGVGAIVLAIGFSAFTAAKKAPSFFYGLNAAGTTYIQLPGQPDLDNCHATANFKCVVGFDNNPGVTSFPATSIPAGKTYDSPQSALYF